MKLLDHENNLREAEEEDFEFIMPEKPQVPFDQLPLYKQWQLQLKNARRVYLLYRGKTQTIKLVATKRFGFEIMSAFKWNEDEVSLTKDPANTEDVVIDVAR